MNIPRQLEHVARLLLFRFDNDQCFLRASSLTFQSLLSFVPLLAVMFGIAKGFGFELLLQQILQREFHDQQEVITHFIQFSNSLLEQTQGGIIAGIGVVVLFFTVMRLLSSVENTLNCMWGISAGRPLARKASDYLALILICPILVLISSSSTLFITTQLQTLTEISPLFLKCIPLIPYIVSTLLFTTVYIVIPYTYVKLSSALWAGAFAGCAYQILQATYISIQIQVTNAGAIYGSFAALPLFLTWLYLSWSILLIGAEILVIHQERQWDLQHSSLYRNLSPLETKLVSLSCVREAIAAFLQIEPLEIEQLTKHLQLPKRVVNERIEALCQANILVKTASNTDEEYRILPATTPDVLSIAYVLNALDGNNSLPGSSMSLLEEHVNALYTEIQTSKDNCLLKDL